MVPPGMWTMSLVLMNTGMVASVASSQARELTLVNTSTCLLSRLPSSLLMVTYTIVTKVPLIKPQNSETKAAVLKIRSVMLIG